MGRVATVISFERREEGGVKWAEVKCDLGGDNIATAIYMPPLGRDSWPFAGDDAQLVESTGLGNYVCIGFNDPQLTKPATEAGEEVVFSRSAPGAIAAKFVLKTDGSIVINDGDVVITADGDVVASGVSLKTHVHGGSTLQTTATVGATATPGVISGETQTPS